VCAGRGAEKNHLEEIGCVTAAEKLLDRQDSNIQSITPQEGVGSGNSEGHTWPTQMMSWSCGEEL
jgi:hypothetical protein